jgi:hypothetical protein
MVKITRKKKVLPKIKYDKFHRKYITLGKKKIYITRSKHLSERELIKYILKHLVVKKKRKPRLSDGTKKKPKITGPSGLVGTSSSTDEPGLHSYAEALAKTTTPFPRLPPSSQSDRKTEIADIDGEKTFTYVTNKGRSFPIPAEFMKGIKSHYNIVNDRVIEIQQDAKKAKDKSVKLEKEKLEKLQKESAKYAQQELRKHIHKKKSISKIDKILKNHKRKRKNTQNLSARDLYEAIFSVEDEGLEDFKTFYDKVYHEKMDELKYENDLKDEKHHQTPIIEELPPTPKASNNQQKKINNKHKKDATEIAEDDGDLINDESDKGVEDFGLLDDVDDIIHANPYENLPEDQTGDGKGKRSGGLYSDQIDSIMKPYKDYLGTIPRDGINKYILPYVKPKKRLGFVMNLGREGTKGYHWVSVFIDPVKYKSVEYYDSYGKSCPSDILKDLKIIVDHLKEDNLLKFKENLVKEQSVNSVNCGFFATKFLIDRFRGISFDETTGFKLKDKSTVRKSEKEIQQWKKQFPVFDYI